MTKPYVPIVAAAMAAAAVSSIASPQLSFGQQRPGQQQQQQQEKKDALAAEAFVADRITPIDRDIAARAVQRAQTPPDQMATLDLWIDLRIVQRWMWDQVAKSPSADVQAAAYARAVVIEEAFGQLEQTLRARAGAGAGGRSQGEAMVALHRLTFTLAEEAKDAREIDRVARETASAIANIASPTPVDLATLPPMRPKAIAPSQPQSSPPGGRSPDRPATLVELSQEARTATVTPALRAQLVALADQARQLDQDPQQKAEADRLTKLLGDTMGMVNGLSSNTAVAVDERMQLETDLAAALALLSDKRLMAAGQARMRALQPYRQTLTRLGRLRLTPDQRQLFAPAFTYAQKAGGEEADKVFDEIDAYASVMPRYDALPTEPPNDPHLLKAVQELRQQVAGARESLAETASGLGASGMMSATADDLAKGAQQVRRCVELLEILHALPPRVQALAAYKPRPTGGLERRMQTIATAIVAPNPTPARDANETALRAIADLGAIAEQFAKEPLAALPGAGVKPYTGGAAQAFDDKVRATITELASSAAAGQELDKAKLDLLRQARDLVAQVKAAAELSQVGAADWGTLSRWADWTLTTSNFDALLTPLQRETTGAVQAVAAGERYDAEALRRLRDRYEPILRFVTRGTRQSEQLAGLPTGVMGSAAKLATPMAGNGFAAERYAGFAAAVWVLADADAAKGIIPSIATRVAPEVGMRPPRGD